ncbi:hypothetical protein PIB30_073199 [Stylosanthes scabra]|uniref:Uncharacterized protein n=1 Tax=Stylosanthes scabra TaxID=79078 RepID=A0ABU6ZMZ6_9FABA|nr:hypothetical protein [Stylosanthes scabra]
MAESSSTPSRENRPPRQHSVTPRNLNHNLGTSQGEDGHHEEEEEHMEQQNMGVEGGGTPSQGNFFTPYVGSTADQRRYRTPSPPPATNQEGMEEDENTPITRRELARILKGKGELTEPTWEINPPFGYHILAKSYPKGYQPPVFRKFDGMGSAKDHIISFLDDLGVFRNH